VDSILEAELHDDCVLDLYYTTFIVDNNSNLSLAVLASLAFQEVSQVDPIF
jgi:hypothetical protein